MWVQRKGNMYHCRIVDGYKPYRREWEAEEEIKNEMVSWPSNLFITPSPNEEEVSTSQRWMHPCLYCSTACRGQEVATIWGSVKKLVQIYSGVLFSSSEEWDLRICWNSQGLRKHYSKWNKSTPKRKPLHSCHCIWNLREKSNVQR